MLVGHRNTSHPVATRVLGTLKDASLQRVLRTPGLKPGIHALVMKRLSPGRRLS